MRSDGSSPLKCTAGGVDQDQNEEPSAHIGSSRPIEEDSLDDIGEHDRATEHGDRGNAPEGDGHREIPANPDGCSEEAPVDRSYPVCLRRCDLRLSTL